MTDQTMTLERSAETLARDARDFWRRGWMPGTGGNLSVRPAPDGPVLMSASGRDKGRLSGEDFVACDLEGRPPGDAYPGLGEFGQGRPSAETPIHCAIFRHLEQVRAVYHVHHVEAVLCSERDREAGETTFAGVEMIKALGFWEPEARAKVPIVPNHADIAELAVEVGNVLERQPPENTTAEAFAPAVMVHNHGFYTWGASPAEARRHVEALAWLYEHSFKQQLLVACR